MPIYKYKGLSLSNKIFAGFLVICAMSTLGSGLLSYFVLKDNALQQSRIDQQSKVESVMLALDYAVSHSLIDTDDLPKILGNDIYEISDVNKMDVVVYDLKGQYLIANKDRNLVEKKSLPIDIVNRVLGRDQRVDIQTYDKKLNANVISSYMLLKNNTLEPIAIVYLPYYHSDSSYLEVFNRYVKYIVLVNLFVIAASVFLSWVISNNLTTTLRKFSDLIARITLFDRDLRPIRYYKNDEISSLVKSYNKMILQIQDQKERLSFTEKEQAWREMAKQVAHEVKNPLTPMKLTIQNFERKFDANDPDIRAKVKKMSSTIVDQIDLIAAVASAFSQFAQLPEKKNEVFDLKEEVDNILQMFIEDRVFMHANKEKIMINMDKIYLSRIITNLITNARQAASPDRDMMINVDLEQINKRIKISVQDNGIGIPENMYERIFEPNFTSKSSGMGLGLSMVRKMIEEYKGEIIVKSEVGIGTAFIITLPSNL
ncbi:ATP-binding protein [Weeksellaceae bacterium A-14]